MLGRRSVLTGRRDISTVNRRDMNGFGKGMPYEESSHGPIWPRQRFNSFLLRKSVHDVEKCDETRSFHRSPANLAWNIESRRLGRLAHGVVVQNPLYDGELYFVR